MAEVVASTTLSRIAAIVVSYNSASELPQCLDALIRTAARHVVVVDNASTDGSAELVAVRFPGVHLIRSERNLGYGGGANLGAGAVDADVYVFLNPDAIVVPGCVEALGDDVARTGGVAGPVLLTGPSAAPVYGTRLDAFGMTLELDRPGAPLYVQGCALAIDSALFRRLGGFDERFFLFSEDAELCFRALRSGSEVQVVTDAIVRHAGGATVAGGYVRDGRRQLDERRFSLRERNTLAMFIANAPAAWLLTFLPVHILKIVGLAVFARLVGREELSSDLIEGLRWNRRELARSIARRRQLVAAPGWWLVLRRRVVPLAIVGHLRRDGLPRFVVYTDRARTNPGP